MPPGLAPRNFADDSKPRFGGTFSTLLPVQQALIRSWYDQYGKITGNQVAPETGYDALKPSVRTSFEAVTHALYKTPLTDQNGHPMGNALD